MRRRFIAEARDPDAEPPAAGALVLAEWEPGRPVPARHTLDGWEAIGDAEGRCSPLTWAELPRSMRASDALAFVGLDVDDLGCIEGWAETLIDEGAFSGAETLKRIRAVLTALEGER